MKQKLSLLIIMALIWSSVVSSYAETTSNSPGEVLKNMGLVSGYANGSLGESDQLTRAQMMVLIAQLKGENELAKNYALPSTSIDVDPYAWYAPYVAYAEAHKWTAGISANRFGPNEYLTSQQAATFMLKILGYSVTNYNTVMDQAYALGILKNGSMNPSEKTTRGNVFQYMLNTLNTPVANSSISLGVSLGVVTPQKPVDPVKKYVVKSATALSNTLIEVKLKEQTSAADMSQFQLRTSNGATLEITKADLIDTTTIWLTTKSQTAGVAYTLIADNEFKFTGMGKDLLAPVLVKDASSVLDFITVRLVFDKEMDPRTALDVSNYTATNGVTFLSAKFDKNKDGEDIRTVVLLSTSSQEKNKLYTLTVSKKVTDIGGNSVSMDDEKNIFRFVGLTADTTAPKLTNVYSLSAQKIILLFDDASDLDEAAAENIGNYSIVNRTNSNSGLSIISAKLVKSASDRYLMVELKTTAQVIGNTYEISASQITDKFGNMISSTNSYKGTFTGQAPDTTGPKILYLRSISNTLVDIYFDETVAKESAAVTSNYSIDNNLSILKAERDEDDDKLVHITTSSQLSSTLYKLKAFGVMDEYGNVNGSSSSNTAYFNGMREDTSSPRIISASASVEDGKTYVTVKYSKSMGDSAKQSGLYYFGTDVGYGLSVTKISDTEYKVRTNSQSEGTSYTVTVSNVYDASGYGLDDNYYKASFFGKAVSDTEPPKIAYVVTADKMTVRLAFNRAMQAKVTEQAVVSDGIPTDSDISDPDNYQIYVEGATTPLALGTYKAYVEKDKMSVTLRLGTNTLDSTKSYTVEANAIETGDKIDGFATSLYSENGLALSTNYSTYDFRGNSLAATKPRIVSAFATSTNTIELKFNMGVKLGTFTTSSLTVTGNGQTLTGVPGNTMVSTTDNSVLLVRLSGKMSTSSTKYQVVVNDLSSITDIYGDLILESSSGGNTATLYSNSIENDGPSLTSVTANDATSVTLLFTKELDSADVSDYRVTTNSAEVIPTYAEFVDSKRDRVRIYFDSTNMSVGKAYRVKIASNAVADIYGKTNPYAEEAYFGLSSVGRTKVTISDFGATGTSTLRVMFSKPIADITSVTSGSDFIITNTPSGGSWRIDKAYSNGTLIVPSSNGALPQNTYFDVLDLKSDKLLGKDTTYTISFANPNNFIAKDGAAIDGTPSASTVGQLNLDSFKLTSGLTTSNAVSGAVKLTITDSNLSSYTVRTNYTKVGAFAKASSPTPFDTQIKLLAGINDFNSSGLMTKSVTGTTEYTVSGLTAGNYDLVVVFYNQKNELVGYYLVTNVAVN